MTTRRWPSVFPGFCTALGICAGLGFGIVLACDETSLPSAKSSVPNIDTPPRGGSNERPGARAGPRGDIWRSRDACLQSAMPRAHSSLRVATWNVKWFPRGSSENGQQETDLDWFVCLVRQLDADVLALQEVLLDDDTRMQIDGLLRELARQGLPYRMYTDDCPRSERRQHLAFWVRTNVDIRSAREVAEMNPLGEACEGNLRPGLALQIRAAGRELNVVTVHLDSGVSARDFRNRQTSMQAIALVQRDTTEQNTIWLGDFNTMGCSGCGREELDEIASMREILGAAGLQANDREIEYTHRSGRYTSRLDHVFAPARMDGWRLRRTQVQGPCARNHGGNAYFARISDHCPLVTELDPE